MKVFKKVSIIDRLPEHGDIVICVSEKGKSHIGTVRLLDGRYICTSAQYTYMWDVEYWLEEVELPNESQIESEADQVSNNSDFESFRDGAYFILKDIL